MTLEGTGAEPRVERGVVHVLCAYEIGQLVDLDAAARRIRSLTERATIKHKRRAPRYFQYHPAPLRVMQTGAPVAIGAYQTAAHVDAVLFDFGAISIAYTISFEGRLGDLTALSAALYDDAALLADARRRVEDLLAAVAPAVTRPHVADIAEEYVIFEIQQWGGAASPDEILHAHAALLAQILRAEREPLSAQEIADATAGRIAFGPDDLTLIDGEAALIFDNDAEDIRAVLEFANVELLEMRYLDQELDDSLDRAYRTVSRQGWRHVLRRGAARTDLQHIAQMQVDGALLFEAVNNALKLIGDQFVARVYRLASDRFHLADWNAGILRKLETLEGIYVKFSDLAGNRRMEMLEWIIIILIAFEIALSLIRG